MSTATLTSKGQITLPQDVRRSLRLQAGDKLAFVPDGEDGFRITAVRKEVQALRGRFAGRVAEAVGLEEMDDAIRSEAADRRRPVLRP
jgi:antitoxin PrlF